MAERETRYFTLHDGSDEAKTDELHKFIEGLGDAVFDWEGHEGGIDLTLTVSVKPGDTIVYDGDQVIVRRKQK